MSSVDKTIQEFVVPTAASKKEKYQKVNKKFQRAEAKRNNNHVRTVPSSSKTKHQRRAMSKDLLSRNKINQQVQNQIIKSKASESNGNRLNPFKTVL